jgi:DNA-directed RNA polymerase specialized sigma24 family protein
MLEAVQLPQTVLYSREYARLILHEALCGNGTLGRADARADVVRVFNTLPVRPRHVMYLRWKGYTLAEIAERVTGKRNRKTGASLVFRAETALVKGLNGGKG